MKIKTREAKTERQQTNNRVRFLQNIESMKGDIYVIFFQN